MMPFTRLDAIAAPLPISNVDTDKILPGQFLKTVSRHGLGQMLFYALRYDAEHRPKPDFILNRAPWNEARILVALDNFGCGSSREHAPWALLDFGITCIIAPSFADIFYGNCFKNGILPIVLPRERMEALLVLLCDPDRARMAVDLEGQTISLSTGETIPFPIAPDRKHYLLNAIDEIGGTLQQEAAIVAHEAARRARHGWLPRTDLIPQHPLPRGKDGR